MTSITWTATLNKIKALSEKRQSEVGAKRELEKQYNRKIASIDNEIISLLADKINFEEVYCLRDYMAECANPWENDKDYSAFEMRQQRLKEIQAQLKDLGLSSIGIDWLCEADPSQEASYEIKVVKNDKIMRLVLT